MLAAHGNKEALVSCCNANKDHKDEMLKARDYAAFRAACGHGHLKVVEFLWGQASAIQKQEMLTANDYGALRKAYGNNHLAVVEFLWRMASREHRKK